MYIDPSFKEYASVLQETKFLSDENKLPKEERKNPIHFQYGDVTLNSFEKKHVSDGWLARKFSAIPYIAWDVLQLIYDLFSGLGGAQDKRSPISYIAVRDLEEIAGRVVTLFSDKVGAFLVQDALFQKKCYEYINNPPPKHRAWSATTLPNGVIIPYEDEAKKLSLWDFSHMPKEKKEKKIKKFDLDANIQAYDAVFEGGFWAQLSRADEQVLRACTIYDLKAEQNLLFLQPLEILLTLQVGQIKDLSSRLQQILRDRFSSIKKEATLSSDQDILTLPYVDFLNVPASDIDKIVSTLPVDLLALISEQQAKEIDLSKLLKEQLLSFINSHVLSFPEVKARFSRLTPQLLRQLDLGSLTAADLRALFPAWPHEYLEDSICRLALLPVEQLQAIVKKLDGDLVKSICGDQLRQLDLGSFTAAELRDLFPTYPDEDLVKSGERLASLQVEQLQAIVKKLDRDLAKSISGDQLRQLDLRSFTAAELRDLFPTYPDADKEKSRLRFRSLSGNQVMSILETSSEEMSSWITNEHLADMDVFKITDAQLGKLFPSFNEQELRKGESRGISYSYEEREYTDLEGERHVEAKKTVQVGTPEEWVKERADKIKQSNLAKMKALTPEQREGIRARLTQENQELLSTLD